MKCLCKSYLLCGPNFLPIINFELGPFYCHKPFCRFLTIHLQCTVRYVETWKSAGREDEGYCRPPAVTNLNVRKIQISGSETKELKLPVVVRKIRAHWRGLLMGPTTTFFHKDIFFLNFWVTWWCDNRTSLIEISRWKTHSEICHVVHLFTVAPRGLMLFVFVLLFSDLIV